jgi:hypothetical protein
MAIDKKEIEKLKASLSPLSEVLTPDSEGYAESIKRWSSAAEQTAVRLLIFSYLISSFHGAFP